MKVKIGDKVFDSNDLPIMLVLSDDEKSLISSMGPEDYRFCSYPSGIKPEVITEFMKKIDN